MALVWILVCSVFSEGWELLPEAPVNEDDRALQEEVEFRLSHPIDLNRATVDEFLSIPWLNPVLAYRIVSFRNALGRFESPTQLRSVPGMSTSCCDMLSRLVTVTKTEPGWGGTALMRMTADTIPFGRYRWSGFGRILAERDYWKGIALWEKDRNEPDLTDWIGMGLGFSKGRFGMVIGDYTFGSGLGVVFSGPYRRANARWAADVKGPVLLKLVKSPLETRALCGAGTEVLCGDWRVVEFLSYVGRDARFNPDGTVARLKLDGLHDDSLSQAERNLVKEFAFGTALSRQWQRVAVTADFAHVRYSRDFAPVDSSSSFFGHALATGGFGADIRVDNYRLGLEGGISTGGGVAGALDLAGDWQELTAGFGLSGYSKKYFAPLGRWRCLTDRKERLYARALLGYRMYGFKFGIRGNTYRDFRIDSLPARLETRLTKRLGLSLFSLKLGRSFELEQRRYRTSQCNIELEPTQRYYIRFTIADKYPEQNNGRGRMAASSLRMKCGHFSGVLSCARFDMTGTGVRMYLHEHGLMRIGSSYSTAESSWRFGVASRFGFRNGSGLGLRLGCTRKATLVFEFGGQLEFGLN